jgi:transcriptional regulator with XRE-family HTH domain
MTTEQLQDNRLRIGQRIAEIRDARGITQRDLSEITGLNPANISKLEGGKYNVSIDILARIAAALECQVELIEK